MLDTRTGKVAYAVLSFGGTLGIGPSETSLFAVPWRALQRDPDNKQFMFDVDKERLEKAPEFDKDHWPMMADTKWATAVHDYDKSMPYWAQPWGRGAESHARLPRRGDPKRTRAPRHPRRPAACVAEENGPALGSRATKVRVVRALAAPQPLLASSTPRRAAPARSRRPGVNAVLRVSSSQPLLLYRALLGDVRQDVVKGVDVERLRQVVVHTGGEEIPVSARAEADARLRVFPETSRLES